MYLKCLVPNSFCKNGNPTQFFSTLVSQPPICFFTLFLCRTAYISSNQNLFRFIDDEILIRERRVSLSITWKNKTKHRITEKFPTILELISYQIDICSFENQFNYLIIYNLIIDDNTLLFCCIFSNDFNGKCIFLVILLF